ncbi:MAG: PEGA domain-containing protein [Pseudobdellovibrionaceae bacterium]
MKKLILFVLAATYLAACSSTTTIRSTDSATKIYIDGEYKGKGVVTHTDTKIVGSTTSVRMEKPGCEPQFYTFSRNEEFDAGACAGGVFVLVPFFWIQKYKPEHVYEYECRTQR